MQRMSALRDSVSWIGQDLRETVIRYFEPIILIVQGTVDFVLQTEHTPGTGQQFRSDRKVTSETPENAAIADLEASEASAVVAAQTIEDAHHAHLRPPVLAALTRPPPDRPSSHIPEPPEPARSRHEVLLSPPVIHNVVVGGRRTSLRMEPVMWDALQDIAHRQQVTVRDLVTDIDRERTALSLTAAVRTYIVDFYRLAGLEQDRAVASERGLSGSRNFRA